MASEPQASDAGTSDGALRLAAKFVAENVVADGWKPPPADGSIMVTPGRIYTAQDMLALRLRDLLVGVWMEAQREATDYEAREAEEPS